MQDDRQPRGLGAQQVERLGERFPVRRLRRVAHVDHERLAEPVRDRDVSAKGPVLVLGRRPVAIEVEPGLTDGRHPRVARKLLDRRGISVAKTGCRVRVQPHAGEDLLVRLRCRDRIPVRFVIDTDREEAAHARLARGGDQLGVRRLAHREMTVRVDHRASLPNGAAQRSRRRKIAAAATSTKPVKIGAQSTREPLAS
jgi:hypothetical protein